MARVTVTKKFELSEGAVRELEDRARLAGTSQTAIVEAWLTSPDSHTRHVQFVTEVEARLRSARPSLAPKKRR